MEAALEHEDPERQLQSQSVGGTDVRFFGHGAGKELDKRALERFFRVVDRGVLDLVGATRIPVVLACVDYYLPIYRAITRLPNVTPTAITGSPEHRSPADLHAAAIALLSPLHAERGAAAVQRFAELAGTGHTLTALDEIANAARDGRIDTLIVAGVDHTPLDPEAERLVDHAIADAVNTGAALAANPPAAIGAHPLAAILRY
jgi:hypothetical protein